MSDEQDLTPLEIIERAANRLYSAAVYFRSVGDFKTEQELLRAAAIVAEKVMPFRHPRMPATIIAPSDLPPLRLMSRRQLEQLALELRQDEYQDVTDEDGKPSGQEPPDSRKTAGEEHE